jgi:hypothetical protein
MVIIPAYTIWLLYFPTGLRNCCSCQRSRRLSAFPAALLFPGHSRHPGSLGGQTGPFPRSRCRSWITEFAHFFYTRRLVLVYQSPARNFRLIPTDFVSSKRDDKTLNVQRSRSNRYPQLKYNYFLTYLCILYVPQRNQNKMWHAHQIKMNSICSAGL